MISVSYFANSEKLVSTKTQLVAYHVNNLLISIIVNVLIIIIKMHSNYSPIALWQSVLVCPVINNELFTVRKHCFRLFESRL